MITIETKNVIRNFGRLRAVDGIDLQVKRGEIFGLLGPNGSGKTTLIRMLAGLLKPTKGEVFILGKRMPDKPILADVGYMTQAIALYEELSVRENVSFFASMCGARSKMRVDEIIDFVELRDRINSKVRNLSGGMKRRTSLACALVHDPKVLLLDEPTVGVDPNLRVAFWEYFRNAAARGISLIVSSHVMDEALRCDRLGFIRDGRMIAVGNHQELIDKVKASDLEDAFLKFARSDG